ncbi:unnamed protein product, partial [Cladocopium goreaui]
HTSAMEQFNIEIGNLRCKLRYHQVEWVSHLSKLLSGPPEAAPQPRTHSAPGHTCQAKAVPPRRISWLPLHAKALELGTACSIDAKPSATRERCSSGSTTGAGLSPLTAKSESGKGDAHRLAPTEAQALGVSKDAVQAWLPELHAWLLLKPVHPALDAPTAEATRVARQAEKRAEKKRLEEEKQAEAKRKSQAEKNKARNKRRRELRQEARQSQDPEVRLARVAALEKDRKRKAQSSAADKGKKAGEDQQAFPEAEDEEVDAELAVPGLAIERWKERAEYERLQQKEEAEVREAKRRSLHDDDPPLGDGSSRGSQDDLAEPKMKLNCSQEQFVDLLQEYHTQQLIQPDLQPKLDQPAGEPPQDQDALPPWVMLRVRNELAEIHKNLSYHPGISQVPDGVWWIQVGSRRRYQLEPNAPPQEPSGLALFNNSNDTDIVEIANDAQGYSKSQLHKLDMSQEIERLLSMSASDERLSEMHSVPELIEDMRSKLQLLEEAAKTQELTISRLREDARKMEEEQHVLSALQSGLAMGVDRAEFYLQVKEEDEMETDK